MKILIQNRFLAVVSIPFPSLYKVRYICREMYPVLFELGPLKLYTYGLMMALGFLAATIWGARRARNYRINPDFISNLSWVYIIGGVIGGRATFLLVEEGVEELFSWRFFEIWQGGMVFYGGLIVAILATYFFCRSKRISFWVIADILAPCIAIGHALGRVGCVFAGCCYGKQCDLPWAITFTNPRGLAPLNIPLHPTQLYEFLGNLAIAGLLVLIERTKSLSRGTLFALYIFMYALLRGTVEVYRGDFARGFVTFGGMYENEWLSTSTFISIVMVAVSLIIWIVNRGHPSGYARSGPTYRDRQKK